MAKRKIRSRKRSQRVTSRNTNASSVLRSRNLRRFRSGSRKRLSLVQDNRFFHPEGKYRRILTKGGREARYTLSSNRLTRKDGTLGKIQFKSPLRSYVCIRRQLRRRMIFRFLNKSGRGGAFRRLKLKMAPRVMNPTSYIKC